MFILLMVESNTRCRDNISMRMKILKSAVNEQRLIVNKQLDFVNNRKSRSKNIYGSLQFK